MAKKQTKDRYDRANKNLNRVGAHRMPRRRGRGILALVWALLAILILVGAGVVAILAINGKLDEGLGGLNLTPGTTSQSTSPPASPDAGDAKGEETAPPQEPSEEPTEEVVPTQDPSLTVIVLNGTTMSGLAGGLTDELANEGWSMAEAANADSSDVATTTVYYSDPEQEGAALGLLEDLQEHAPDAEAQLADPGDGGTADMTVVIGADYIS